MIQFKLDLTNYFILNYRVIMDLLTISQAFMDEACFSASLGNTGMRAREVEHLLTVEGFTSSSVMMTHIPGTEELNATEYWTSSSILHQTFS